MKDNEYKELKTYDEMSRKEKRELRLSSRDPRKEEAHDSILFDIVGLITCIIIAILFCGMGIVALLQANDVKILGVIFLTGGLYITYKGFIFARDIKANILKVKKTKNVVITLSTIAYFIYSLPVFTSVLVISLMVIDPGNEFLTRNHAVLVTSIIVEIVLGSLLLAINVLTSGDIKIIEIGKNKKK